MPNLKSILISLSGLAFLATGCETVSLKPDLEKEFLYKDSFFLTNTFDSSKKTIKDLFFHEEINGFNIRLHSYINEEGILEYNRNFFGEPQLPRPSETEEDREEYKKILEKHKKRSSYKFNLVEDLNNDQIQDISFYDGNEIFFFYSKKINLNNKDWIIYTEKKETSLKDALKKIIHVEDYSPFGVIPGDE